MNRRGRNYAAGDDTKRLKYAPKRLVPEFHWRLIPLPQNPEPSPTSVLRAYFPSGPKFPKRATRLFAFLITTPLSRQLIGPCLFCCNFNPNIKRPNIRVLLFQFHSQSLFLSSTAAASGGVSTACMNILRRIHLGDSKRQPFSKLLSSAFRHPTIYVRHLGITRSHRGFEDNSNNKVNRADRL